MPTLACAALGLVLSACERGASPPAPSVQAAGRSPEVAATLGGEPITLETVDAQVMASNMDVIQKLYDARRQAVEEIVEERLFAKEAKERGVTPEELIAQEVDAKVDDISDEAVATFFEQNKAAVGDQTLEQLTPRIRLFLSQRALRDRRVAFLSELKQEAKFEMKLEPPRRTVTVAPDEPAKGPADAPVTIVEYSDFQCPFCARVVPTMDEVVAKYGDQVRLVYRDFPLAMHADAQVAAEAAQCAHAQGKFWPYHDVLFANQSALDKDSLKKYAADLGLDQARFDACLESDTYRVSVREEMDAGGALGVSGTPAFFVNGRFVSGALPLARFQEIIDDELERAQAEKPS